MTEERELDDACQAPKITCDGETSEKNSRRFTRVWAVEQSKGTVFFSHLTHLVTFPVEELCRTVASGIKGRG